MNEKNKLKLWIVATFVFLIVSVFLIVFIYNRVHGVDAKNEHAIISTENNDQIEFSRERRALDGVFVRKGEENNFPVIVMIDNHADARPSAGLSHASVVIEAEAEGGITRYMAVFDSGMDIEKIGPVRSARPYFVNWARELSGLYVHVGGSPEALVKIAKENVNDFNEFYKGEYFWRGDDKEAPHNVYTSMDNIREYLDKKDFKEGGFFTWLYKKEENKESLPDSSNIEIKYLIKSFVVDWKYDKENNEYIRYLGGEPHIEDSGDIVAAKNILIQYVLAREIDSKLRLKMEIVGEGNALVCLDGKCKSGKWKKKTESARTRFYSEDESEFEFNPGLTWINVVRPEYKVFVDGEQYASPMEEAQL